MSRTRGKKAGAAARGSKERAPAGVEELRGAVFLSTPHAPENYSGLMVVQVGPQWPYAVICTREGQTVAALGGERAAGYETPGGGVAREFSLRRGDRATLVRTGLPHMLGEWRIERAGGTKPRRVHQSGRL